jgi:hypothetical protein
MRRRRRSLVLVPAALLSAACTRTRNDDRETQDALNRDLTLAAQMENRPVDPARPEASSGGGVCAAQPRPAAPTARQRQEAASLAQRAQQAEIVGDTRAARELLARAVQLDATEKDVVYHLGRADEALGRTADAAREYCQYLSLVPGAAGAAEANARLAALGTPSKAGASRSARRGASWRSPSVASTRSTRVGYAVSAPDTGAATSAMATTPSSRRDVPAGAPGTTIAAAPGTTSGEAAGHRAGHQNGDGIGDVAAADTTIAAAPTTPQPAATPAPARRNGAGTSHVARDATIGAAAGAAVGAVMTRSARGAGIGAIAGGLLGAISGGR